MRMAARGAFNYVGSRVIADAVADSAGPVAVECTAPIRAAEELVAQGVRESVSLNRFHQAASRLSEQGQNNIRILRNWAKSKGWVRMPSNGGPEKWGKFQKGKFEWNLIIKPEASVRPGLKTGSNIPRFDARLGPIDQYINPFTGQIGRSNVGTHIPLEVTP